MAVTVTGSKYGAISINSVGTTTRVIISTGNFVSGDFTNTARILGLWDSTGATFKGIAWVRRHINTNELEIEKPFINPATGVEVTQVVGDRIQVSKNWAEIATTGIAVDGDRVTCTDNIIWGTAGSKDSVCFYDECVNVRFTQSSTVNTISGGLVVQGHLDDFTASRVFNGCDWTISSVNSGWAWVYSNSEASGTFLFYGGSIKNTLQPASYSYLGSWAGTGNDFNIFVANGVDLFGIDVLSRQNGGNWTNGLNHIVKNCTQVCGNNNNSILQRWGNGVTEGNTFKITKGSSSPLSIFGSDAAGTFNVRSPASTRIAISDIGVSNVLWRSGSNAVQTVNYTNIVTPNQEVTSSGGTITQSFKFSDSLSNLQVGSTCVIELNSDKSIVDSTLSSASSWSGTVDWDLLINAVRQSGYRKGPWTFGVKKYGYNPVSGSIVESTINQYGAGNAPNVAWAQIIIQTVDSSVSLSQASALALTSIDTLDNFYDRAIAWSCQTAANAQYPTLGSYPVSANGTVVDLGSKNLIVDATAASAFAINTGTNTITIKSTTLSAGTKLNKIMTTGTITFVNGASPGTTLIYQDTLGLRVAINVLNVFPNSRVQLYNVDTSNELFNGIVSGTSYSQQILFSTNQTIRYRAMYANGTTAKKWVEASATLTGSGLNITLNQEDDLIYNSIGIDGSTVSECSIVGSSLVININDADNKTTAQRLLAFEIAWLYTEDGMRDQNLYIEYPDSTHLIFLGGLKIKNIKPSPPLSVTGASIVPETGDPADVIDSTGGSININTDRVVNFSSTEITSINKDVKLIKNTVL